jgi:hypothetical protein
VIVTARLGMITQRGNRSADLNTANSSPANQRREREQGRENHVE